MAYEHKRIEEKWRKHWKDAKTYRVENDTAKPKYYVLDMFPYPSGAGLHVGHPLGYIASDIVARYKRHSGFNVLHPMGYDSFGLPAEQYAIQTGQHPAKTTEVNIARYREQLDRIGFSFDWSREVRTSDPAYYKWTQWIFLQLFESWYDHAAQKARPIQELVERFEKHGWTGEDDSAITGNEELDPLTQFSHSDWATFSEKHQQQILLRFRLAYLSEAWVNWCPALGTVLANDEVKDGVSERGGHPVERKRMPQWSMRITAYAQRLLDGLNDVDWSESIKEAQRNWIGRSEGALIRFPMAERSEAIEVFTTRPDTIFGVSFVTLAPEHELIEKITPAENREEVMAYVTQAKNRSERERLTDVKKVSGVFTGAYVKHPFTHLDVPVWVGDYVLGGYGTGAVMAVPAGDQRDWNFATHFKIPFVAVTENWDISTGADESKEATLTNSVFLNGLKVADAIPRAIDELEAKGVGEGRINFRLRDAAFGRQRYWGEPIPIYYKDGVPHGVAEGDLPVVLPEVDKFLPTEDGEPPLARATNWNYKGLPYETTTMPGWAGSSWYFLRYMDPHNEGRFASPEAINYWQQVDLYVGGSEHATGHLLYFRFWTKFLHDRGWLPFDEPAKKLMNQGMIQGVSAELLRWKPESQTTGTHPGLRTKIYWSYEYYLALLPGSASDQRDLFKRNYEAEVARFNREHPAEAIHDSSARAWMNAWMMSSDTFETSRVLAPIENIIPGSVGTVDVQKAAEALPEFRDAFFFKWDNSFLANRPVEKMSKSKFNVVNPDDIIEKYGADTLRLYEMFLGPIEQSKPWDTNGIEGTSRFLKKFWNLFHLRSPKLPSEGDEGEIFTVTDEAPTKPELKVLHATLKKVTEDIEKMSFNTSVSQFMIAVNELGALKCHKRDVLEPLTIALAPFAPHIAEELWSLLGHTESVTGAQWPQWDAQHLVEDNFSYPISFNGKTRLQLEFPVALSKEEVEAAVLANPEVQLRLEGKAPKKVIVVPKRIVNIVV
ncbi:MAG: leucine--tRNA ligase [Flavobacteriales bacterium]|nr:leucine--tRNA ligase [Flavobacteriales bacterium]